MKSADTEVSAAEMQLAPMLWKRISISRQRCRCQVQHCRTAADIHGGVKDAEKSFGKSLSLKVPLAEYQPDNKAFVTFLFRGNANNVRHIISAPYGGHAQMSKIEGSDICFALWVPDSTRLSYRIAPNVPQLARDTVWEQRRAVLATAALDPLNLGA